MTTMIDTDDSKHDGQVITDWSGFNFSRGECSCGWRGPNRSSPNTARADLRRHYREVKAEGESDG